LRIRKKKRPAPPASAPEGVAKKSNASPTASPSSPNMEDLTEVR
jgi:hypothetical protein